MISKKNIFERNGQIKINYWLDICPGFHPKQFSGLVGRRSTPQPKTYPN